MSTYKAINRNLKFIITEDKNVGYYLTIYPLGSSKSTADYLCDNLEDAFAIAYEKYGVDNNNWKKE